MQPPTGPTPRAHGQADELYRRHHRDVQHAVAGAVRASSELIEDACQTAWMIMLRTRPQCHCAFAWLRAVAIHEAYHLMASERHKAAVALLAPRIEDLRHVGDQRSLDDALEALEALRRLASLPERQRTDLALQIAGYSYKEIQARTPGRTITNVNKSLVKARARIGRSRA